MVEWKLCKKKTVFFLQQEVESSNFGHNSKEDAHSTKMSKEFQVATTCSHDTTLFLSSRLAAAPGDGFRIFGEIVRSLDGRTAAQLDAAMIQAEYNMFAMRLVAPAIR